MGGLLVQPILLRPLARAEGLGVVAPVIITSDRSRIVQVTIYLTDMANFPAIVDARRTYRTAPYPADTIVEMKSLALPELMLEIDVIATAG